MQQKYAVSIKLAYYLIATPTLALGLVLYYDVISLVTIFSNQNYVVLAKLPDSAKSPGDDSGLCCVSNNVLLSRSTMYFDPTLTDCLSCVEFDRHLVSVSSSGAHFNCCAYIIDLTQH